jgi:hypothetical protein
MMVYSLPPPSVVCVGEWLSLVEHLVRDQGVGGSNPLSPTNYFNRFPSRKFSFFVACRAIDPDEWIALRNFPEAAAYLAGTTFA